MKAGPRGAARPPGERGGETDAQGLAGVRSPQEKHRDQEAGLRGRGASLRLQEEQRGERSVRWWDAGVEGPGGCGRRAGS